jgi:hypothetical protein
VSVVRLVERLIPCRLAPAIVIQASLIILPSALCAVTIARALQ